MKKKRLKKTKAVNEPVVWNNRMRIAAAREHSALEKETAAKWTEFHKKREFQKTENELALYNNLDPIAVLKECIHMIRYVLNDGYYFTGGKES